MSHGQEELPRGEQTTVIAGRPAQCELRRDADALSFDKESQQDLIHMQPYGTYYLTKYSSLTRLTLSQHRHKEA